MEEKRSAGLGINLEEASMEGRGVESGSERRYLRREMVGFTLKSKIFVIFVRVERGVKGDAGRGRKQAGTKV